MDRLKYIINILIVAILFGVIAIGKDARLLGHDAKELFEHADNKTEVETEIVLEDGTRVINSTSLAKDVIGYGGQTPIKLYIKDGTVERVEYQPNSETPSFFDQLIEEGIFDSWNGEKLSVAATKEVDVVSGATYSSMAIIKNVQRAAAYASDEDLASHNPFKGLEAKTIIGILVILTGVVITFVRPKNGVFQVVQQVLNVLVLGFWCGSFLSLSQFVSWMSNGFNFSTAMLAILLLGVVIIAPLFGKKGSYCHIHCPMGAAQDLVGRVPVPKLKLGQKANKFLNKLRYYILLALLFMIWLGVGFDLIDYEIFSAFLLSSASTVVLVMASVFLVLSLFVTKPYCRFICPTGAMLTMMQKTKE